MSKPAQQLATVHKDGYRINVFNPINSDNKCPCFIYTKDCIVFFGINWISQELIERVLSEQFSVKRYYCELQETDTAEIVFDTP